MLVTKSTGNFALGDLFNGVPFLLGRMASHGSLTPARRVCVSKDKCGVPCRCVLRRIWYAPPTTGWNSDPGSAAHAVSRVSKNSLLQRKLLNFRPTYCPVEAVCCYQLALVYIMHTGIDIHLNSVW